MTAQVFSMNLGPGVVESSRVDEQVGRILRDLDMTVLCETSHDSHHIEETLGCTFVFPFVLAKFMECS